MLVLLAGLALLYFVTEYLITDIDEEKAPKASPVPSIPPVPVTKESPEVPWTHRTGLHRKKH